MSRESDWRDEIYHLSDEDLDDELSRPTGSWERDVSREALRRIMKTLNQNKEKSDE